MGRLRLGHSWLLLNETHEIHEPGLFNPWGDGPRFSNSGFTKESFDFRVEIEGDS